MPSSSPPSPRDRREFYRITVNLPISLQAEKDSSEVPLVEKAVNISGGGIGVIVEIPYRPDEILSCKLRLSDDVLFTSTIEVLRVEPIPYPPGTYRLQARFFRLPSEIRELLIRHIMRFQRDHLTKHYSA